MPKNARSIRLPTIVGKGIAATSLLDTGAAGIFMNKRFALKHGIETRLLRFPMTIYNVDRTVNTVGGAKENALQTITVGGKTTTHRFLITDLGAEDIILGLPWFKRTNPNINWSTGTITINKTTVHEVPDEPFTRTRNPTTNNQLFQDEEEEMVPELLNDEEDDDQSLLIRYIAGEPVISIFDPDEETPLTREEPELHVAGPRTINRLTTGLTTWTTGQQTWIKKVSNPAQEFALTADKKVVEVPDYLKNYSDLFDKAAAARFPTE